MSRLFCASRPFLASRRFICRDAILIQNLRKTLFCPSHATLLKTSRRSYVLTFYVETFLRVETFPSVATFHMSRRHTHTKPQKNTFLSIPCNFAENVATLLCLDVLCRDFSARRDLS